MRAVNALLLLLQLSGCALTCSSSPFTRRNVSPRALKAPTRRQIDHRILDVRGGQQQANDGVVDAAIPPSGVQPATPVQEAAASPVPSTSTAPVPAKSGKLSNFQERAPPAILMLGATYLLLRFLGEKGLIGLILAMQVGMYSETFSVVDDFNSKNGGSVGDSVIASFPLQKWWWFATALTATSGRSVLTKFTSVSIDKINLAAFGMAAVGLVWAVVQLAMVSSAAAEDIYRSYLGKVACCHFSLLFLVGQSSFWIKTVQEYGLVWVLFPAFLVIVNDTMAYVFGVLMGKHKLLPRLSPKKTVEGFVGAGFSTMAVAAPLLKRMLGDSDVSNITRHALILALYVSLVSPFGGFLASAVKRAHGAKDFGALIPGHGGVVDRFDCQVVTAPFVYLYLKNFFNAAVASAAE